MNALPSQEPIEAHPCLMRRLKMTLALLMAVGGLAAVLITLVGETRLVDWLMGLPGSTAYRRLWGTVSDGGLYVFYGGFALLLMIGLWQQRSDFRRWAQAYLLAQLIGSILLVRALKLGFGRGRPDSVAPGEWTGPTLDPGLHAFPSGHTTDAFTGALLAALWLPHPLLRLLALALAALVGFARIAAGEHWPWDVLAGMLLGSCTAAMAAYFWLLPRLGRGYN